MLANYIKSCFVVFLTHLQFKGETSNVVAHVNYGYKLFANKRIAQGEPANQTQL